MLPSEVPKLTTDLSVRVFPGVWKLLSILRLPSRDGSPSLSFVSLFIFYIFSYLLSKTMGSFSGCLLSFAVIQRLFCGIYSVFKCSFVEFVGERVVSLSYSSAILEPPLIILSYTPYAIFQVFPVHSVFFHMMPRHIIFISWNNNQRSLPVNFSFQNQAPEYLRVKADDWLDLG